VGALVCRGGTPLAPVLHGGEQERGRRSGTPNVAGIAAMAAALGVTVRDRGATGARVAALRDRLVDGLLAVVPDIAETGDRSAKVAGNAHLCVDGVESEALVVLLDDAGVAASAGASCASGAVEPSHVLLAMGYDARRASSGVRFSLGWSTSPEEVDAALDAVPGAVARLRD
jgi:cysteine desulfurase